MFKKYIHFLANLYIFFIKLGCEYLKKATISSNIICTGSLVHKRLTTTCQEGFYLLNNVCNECLTENCNLCVKNGITCLYCNSPYVLQSNACANHCNIGHEQINSFCIRCPPYCTACKNSLTINPICLNCDQDYFLYNHTCVSSCPPGYTPITNECTKCDATCSLCLGSTSFCTECSNPEKLLSPQIGTCTDSCLETEIALNKICQPCENNCYECFNSPQNCTTCSSNFVMYINGDTDTNSCILECPEGFYAHNMKCYPCIFPCKICSSATECYKCESNFFLITEHHYCITECPTGYFPFQLGNNLDICKPCDQKCLTCRNQDPNACLSCKKGYYLIAQSDYNSGTCFVNCPNGYYQFFDQCLPCLNSCHQCSIENPQCIESCEMQNNFLYDNFTCGTECPKGYYQYIDSITSQQRCSKCSFPCLECKDTSINCLSCQQNQTDVQFLFIQNSTGICLSDCPIGYFTNNGACLKCIDNCLICKKSNGKCMLCELEFFYDSLRNICSDDCTPGLFKNYINRTCDNCQFPCFTCSDSSNFCTDCLENYYLDALSGTCQQECGPGKYVNITSKACLPCHSSCLTCSNSSDNCTSCNEPLAYNKSLNLCVQNCGDGWFINYETKTCEKCDSTCATCNLEAINCQSCVEGFSLLQSECVATCPDGTYMDNNKCVFCDSTCQKCDNQNKCNLCYNGYYLNSNNECTSLICSTGSYLNIQTLACEQCNTLCKECYDTDTHCLNCPENLVYDYQSLSCLNTCPSEYYPDSNYTCTPLPPGCLIYQNEANICQECQPNNVLLNSICQNNNSPEGFYWDGMDNVACPINCLTCLSSSLCTSCQQDYVLNKLTWECASTCPDGTFLSNNFCFSCKTNCLKCNSTSCLECDVNYIIQNDLCVKFCPVNTYYEPSTNTCSSSCLASYVLNSNTRLCEKCFDPCSTCSISPSNCTSCYPGYIYDPLNFRCTINCSQGYFVDALQEKIICSPCNSTCENCFGNSNNCISCSSGTNLSYYEGNCLAKCPEGYFSQNSKCFKCNFKCKTCSNTSENCTSCKLPYLLDKINGGCLIECSKGYFFNNASKTCQKCNSNCKFCVGSEVFCESCKDDSFLNKELNICASNCSSSQIVAQNNCLPCVSGCEICATHSGTCKKCMIPNYLHFNTSTCLSSCLPENSLVLISNTCYSCSPQCHTCSNNPFNCTSCYGEQFLYNSGDSNICISYCPDSGFFVDKIYKTCLKCQENCLKCKTDKDCMLCADNLLILVDVGSCIHSCPVGYYQSGQSCLKCSQNCKTCIDADNKCTSCFRNNTFSSDTFSCLSSEEKCPDYYYMETGSYENICLGCTIDNCLRCSYSRFECEICSPDYLLIKNITSICVKNCPKYNYYVDINNKQCLPCSLGCQVCESSPTNCTQCNTDFPFLFNGSCYSSCPSSTYYDLQKSECLSCNSECPTCEFNKFNCSSCPSNKYLTTNNVCSNKCDTNSYHEIIQEKIGDWVKCHQCFNSSSSYCLSNCLGIIFDANNTCLDKCPVDELKYRLSYDYKCILNCDNLKNQYYNYSTKACQTNCSDNAFTNIIDNSCVEKCSSGLIQHKKKCYKTCPGSLIQSYTICPREKCLQEYDSCVKIDLIFQESGLKNIQISVVLSNIIAKTFPDLTVYFSDPNDEIDTETLMSYINLTLTTFSYVQDESTAAWIFNVNNLFSKDIQTLVRLNFSTNKPSVFVISPNVTQYLILPGSGLLSNLTEEEIHNIGVKSNASTNGTFIATSISSLADFSPVVINNLQELSIMKYFPIEYPPIIKMYLDSLGIFNFFFQFGGSNNTKKSNKNGGSFCEISKPIENESLIPFTKGIFDQITFHLTVLMSLIVIIVIFEIVVKICYKTPESKKNGCGKRTNDFRIAFRGAFFPRMLLTFYTPITLTVICNIYFRSFSDLNSFYCIFEMLVTYFLFIFYVIGIPVFIFTFLPRNRHLLPKADFKDMYVPYYASLRTSKWSAYTYYGFTTVRKAFNCSLVIIATKENVFLIAVLILSLQIFHIMVVIIVRPFNVYIKNVLAGCGLSLGLYMQSLIIIIYANQVLNPFFSTSETDSLSKMLIYLGNVGSIAIFILTCLDYINLTVVARRYRNHQEQVDFFLAMKKVSQAVFNKIIE